MSNQGDSRAHEAFLPNNDEVEAPDMNIDLNELKGQVGLTKNKLSMVEKNEEGLFVE
jgi:hypothetical protein